MPKIQYSNFTDGIKYNTITSYFIEISDSIGLDVQTYFDKNILLHNTSDYIIIISKNNVTIPNKKITVRISENDDNNPNHFDMKLVSIIASSPRHYITYTLCETNDKWYVYDGGSASKYKVWSFSHFDTDSNTIPFYTYYMDSSAETITYDFINTQNGGEAMYFYCIDNSTKPMRGGQNYYDKYKKYKTKYLELKNN